MHKSKKIAVIKIGSSVLAPRGRINNSVIKNIARQLTEAKKAGWNICMVSSGAIAAGIKILGFKKYPVNVSRLQAAASAGQIFLMEKYARSFSRCKTKISQILLTWDDFHWRSRYLNAKHTIQALWQHGIIPIINENDTISTEEIKFGDNDKLSALAAGLLDAGKLILLSDVNGIYNDKGEIIKELDFKNVYPVREYPAANREVVSYSTDTGPNTRREFSNGIYYGKDYRNKQVYTRGGIKSKIEAAKMAAFAGIEVFIASGNSKSAVLEIISGKNPGTRFIANFRIPAKKLWIAFARRPKGELIVDKGAENALVNKKSSLLSVGIKDAKGEFEAKDTVYIKNDKGEIIGAGTIKFSFPEMRNNLGRKLPKEVIHRDEMLIF